MADPLQIAVVGAGQMGVGFAVHFRRYGQRVTLVDHRQSNLDNARAHARETVQFLQEHDVASASAEEVLDGIEFTLDMATAAREADIVLETVPEDLDVKRDVFESLGEATSSETILATNTSSLPITKIAKGFDFADRIVGCHWLYPPYLLPTVEVIAGEETADDVVDQVVAFLEAVDRRPIVVDHDIPGFVWNRVQFAVLRECLHIVESGAASIEDVNAAIRDGYARRTAVLGPFETVDLAGLELFETVASELYPTLSDADAPSELFEKRLAEGRHGVKTGSGFLSYDRPESAVERERDKNLIAVDRALDEQDDR